MNLLQGDFLKDRFTLVATVSAVAAAAGLALYFYSENNGNGADSEPVLTLNETQEILAKILERIRGVALKHSRAGQHIKQQLEQQGQSMPESEIFRQFILPHFENAIQEIQDAVLEEYDVEEDELEACSEHYSKQGDAKVIEIVNKIRRMHKEFGGENDGDDGAAAASSAAKSANKNIDFETICEILQTLAERVGNATDAYAGAFIEQYGPPQSQDLLERFQQGMLLMSEELESSLLDGFGISQNDFQVALMAHENNPMLRQLIMQMQYQNQARLAKHGIAMMG